MFDITKYPFDTKHNCISIAGEAMIFHCHHYLSVLLRTILDAEYIDSRPFIIGSAADAAYNQLSNLCAGLDRDQSKKMVEDVYKTFGYGLINISSMDENGVTVQSTKSVFSRAWKQKFGLGKKPVDF